MSYSRRELYALGEPIGDSATYRKVDGGLVLGDGGGGGGSAPADTTQTQTTELPEWARGYAKDVLAKGQALTDISQNPYQRYGGQRTADFSGLQNQSFQNAQNIGPNPLTAVGGMNALTAGQNYQRSATDPNAVGAYMSPYVQNVLNNQMASANRQYDITGMQQRAGATQANAFGGGRDAVMRMENERARNSALQGIQAKGLQDAFQNAQQSQQFGANLGLQGAQAAAAAGQNLYGQAVGATTLQNQLGAQQQAQAQKGLDINYQEFLNEQNQPYKQLSYMSDLIRGQPLGMQSTNQVYQAPPSSLQSMTSLGLGAAGIASLAKADGGVIHGYADGGSVSRSPMHDEQAMSADVSKLSDEQLQQVLQHPTTRAEFEAAQSEAAFRASMQNGLASAITPGMAQNMTRAAGGGILAFKEDGYIDVPEEREDRQDVYSPGDSRAFSGFNQEILRSMEAIRNQKPATMSDQDYNKAISNRYAMLGKLSGPDPYADSLTDLGEQEKGVSGIGNLARASALFEAADAAVQGGNAVRGITGAGSKLGQGFAQAAKAEALERRSLNNAKFAIKDAQRKERMGMTKDSIGAADDARRSISDANKFGLEKEKALGNLAAQGAKIAKPTGGAGGAKQVKLAEQLGAAEIAHETNPTAQTLKTVTALRRAVGATKDVGPGKLDVSNQGNEIKRIKMYEEALGDLKVNKEYVRATPERQRAMEAEVRTRVMSQPLPQDDGAIKLARGGNIGPIKLD